ncbi:MAG: hybrid sensor histidine kinase/response regulator [Deltaproteobacteria bacterium]|nr:hybrid sensor histidine kinase/response regulator [Deltaproteobacteria bacterium]
MRAIVIEDSRTQAKRVADLLERAGFAVDLAYDGASGVQACIARTPDVVVSDVLMPKLDGFEVCRRLRAHAATANVPIMLLTSLAEPLDVVRAVAAGADNFASKPIRDDVFLARLERMLRHARLRDGEPSLEIGGDVLRIEASGARILEVLFSSLEDAKLRQEELQHSRDELERANVDREALMGIVAHELRTPLSGVTMRVQASLRRAAKGGWTAGMIDDVLQYVLRSGERMLHLIDDLIDVAHLQKGTLDVARAPFDLVECAREAVARVRATDTAHRIHLTAPPRAIVVGDVERADQVLTNFLTNAIKYAPTAPDIDVTIEAAGDSWRASVVDRGIGIGPESLPRVFERYHRTPEGERVAKGLGLGLYISRMLMELQGGAIGVASSGGEGTTFWFSLPRA